MDIQDKIENKRVLFTIPPTHSKVTDYGAILTSHIHKRCVNWLLNASYPINSWGLYWIKENCPTIEILDAPNWKNIKKELKKGVDILGISFYTYQVPDVIRLVTLARKYGVKEIWGGNYGVQTPGIKAYFDKIIYGNGEFEVHKLLYGKELKRLKHPVCVHKWDASGLLGSLINLSTYKWHYNGILWTIKGCYSRCKFCPSTKFIGSTIAKLPLPEIERILDVYKNMGINSISIMDLDFFMDKIYADQVLNLLLARGMTWTCMTRIDHIKGRIKELKEKGASFLFIGVENLNARYLKEQLKYNTAREEIEKIFEEFDRNKLNYFLFYMLGFEDETVESIKRDIDFLSTLKSAALYQFQVVTPLPGSSLFEEYKSRVINWNWADWHCNSLVWKHPNITPQQMEDILIYAKKKTSLLNTTIRRILNENNPGEISTYLGYIGKKNTVAVIWSVFPRNIMEL